MKLTDELRVKLEDIAAGGASSNGSASGAPFRPTDLGNAERLVAQHGADLRYVPGIGWHAWDGRRWRRDDDGEVMRRAKLAARSILADAQHIEDADARKPAVKWSLVSETEPRLRAVVSLAESERAVIAHADELDSATGHLNVLNGTIDLRAGELREHRREDYVTQLAPVAYDPEARCPLWENVLARASGDDHELAGSVQRFAGYTATGEACEDKLAFPHGPGATAKTTVVEGITFSLGDYAATADFETFLKQRGDAGIRNDIARLRGKRMVVSIEVDEGRRFAEGLVKTLTGGDVVAARFLYREAFEFRPAFVLWLVANARPRVNAADDAIWRRIVQVPSRT